MLLFLLLLLPSHSQAASQIDPSCIARIMAAAPHGSADEVYQRLRRDPLLLVSGVEQHALREVIEKRVQRDPEFHSHAIEWFLSLHFLGMSPAEVTDRLMAIVREHRKPGLEDGLRRMATCVRLQWYAGREVEARRALKEYFELIQQLAPGDRAQYQFAGQMLAVLTQDDETLWTQADWILRSTDRVWKANRPVALTMYASAIENLAAIRGEPYRQRANAFLHSIADKMVSDAQTRHLEPREPADLISSILRTALLAYLATEGIGSSPAEGIYLSPKVSVAGETQEKIRKAAESLMALPRQLALDSFSDFSAVFRAYAWFALPSEMVAVGERVLTAARLRQNHARVEHLLFLAHDFFVHAGEIERAKIILAQLNARLANTQDSAWIQALWVAHIRGGRASAVVDLPPVNTDRPLLSAETVPELMPDDLWVKVSRATARVASLGSPFLLPEIFRIAAVAPAKELSVLGVPDSMAKFCRDSAKRREAVPLCEIFVRHDYKDKIEQMLSREQPVAIELAAVVAYAARTHSRRLALRAAGLAYQQYLRPPPDKMPVEHWEQFAEVALQGLAYAAKIDALQE